MRKTKAVVSTLALASLLAACAHAAPNNKRPDGPPPEAFAACEGQSEGAKVTVEGRNGEAMKAVCEEHDGKLVAVPTDAPRGR